MTQIKISDGIKTITLPRTRDVKDVGQIEYKDKTMASGRIVRAVLGFRPAFEYAWDYVPAQTIKDLTAMLRTADFFNVEYFDVDGVDKKGIFSVSYPSFEVFTFRNDIAMWHNCSLTISSQGVI